MNYQEYKCIPELLKLVSSLNKFIFLKLIRLRQHFLAPPLPRPQFFILRFLCVYFARTYSPLGNFTWIPCNWPWFFPSILAFVTGTIHHVSASNSITGVIWNLCLFDYLITFYTTVGKIIWETNEMRGSLEMCKWIYLQWNELYNCEIFSHIHPNSRICVSSAQPALCSNRSFSMTPFLEHTNLRQWNTAAQMGYFLHRIKWF